MNLGDLFGLVDLWNNFVAQIKLIPAEWYFIGAFMFGVALGATFRWWAFILVGIVTLGFWKLREDPNIITDLTGADAAPSPARAKKKTKSLLGGSLFRRRR